MKRIMLLLCLLLALSLGAAMADTLVLPNDTTVIGDQAFYGTDADTIILPEGVTSIGDQAFGGSESLQTVYVPDALMDREADALSGSPNAHFVSLAEDWSEIYDYTVSGDSVTITKYKGSDAVVRIPARIEGKPVSVIGASAFQKQSTLTQVVIPEGVIEIRDSAFRECPNLTDFTFPDTLSRIETNAFWSSGTTAEDTVYYRLPDNLTYISGISDRSTYAFNGCNAVMMLNLDSATARLFSSMNDENKGWFTCEGETDYRYKYFQSAAGGEYDTLHLMKYLGSSARLAIPEHSQTSARISVIHARAFENQTQLTAVTIPEGVSEIQSDGFKRCYLLTDVTFPSTLSVIGSNAFWNCGANAEETFYYRLPDHLTSIYGMVSNNTYAFDGCPAVMLVTPDSETARLLSSASADNRGWFTYQGETDFRYKYYQSAEGGEYDTLHLMKYVGSDTEISIPDHGSASTKISVIHNEAIYKLSDVTQLIIPEGVTEIQYNGIRDCAQLTDISFPSTLLTIGADAFWCTGKSAGSVFFFDLPDTVTNVHAMAFNGCKARVTCSSRIVYDSKIENGETFWWGWRKGSLRENYITIETDTGTAQEVQVGGYVMAPHAAGSLTVEIAEEAYAIEEDCFAGRDDIGHVSMANVRIIKDRAFRNCGYLTDITFSEPLAVIGDNAFTGCGNRAGVSYTFELPDNLHTVSGTEGDPTGSFYDCNAILTCTKNSTAYMLLTERYPFQVHGR